MSSFRIEEKRFTIGLDMAIRVDGKQIGVVEERNIALTSSFTLYDADKQKIATARKAIFSFGEKIEIYDQKDKFIGSLEEQVFRNLFSISSAYTLKDEKGVVIGSSEKMSLLSTSFTIRDTNNLPVITFKKDLINVWSTGWGVTIKEGNTIDPRLIAFIASYKTSADAQRKEEQEKKRK